MDFPKIPISYFKPQFSKKRGIHVPGMKPYETDFYTEMFNIKNGKYFEQVRAIREEPDHEKRQEIKGKTLNALTISATVDKYRKTTNCKHTGLLNIDVDPKENTEITDWPYTRDLIFELPGVVASFLSVSGKGVTFVVKIDPKQHKDTFYSIKDELYDNLNIVIDKGTHDISRLRYVSFDPDLKIRTDYDQVPVTVPSQAYLFNKSQQKRITTVYETVTEKDSDECFRLAVKKAESKYGTFSDGCKHYFLTIVAGACNVRGMSEKYCGQKVVEYYSHLTNISIEDLLQPVKNVYRTYKSQFDTAEAKNKSARLNDHIASSIVTNYIHKGITPKPSDLSHIAQEHEANIDRVNEVANRVIDEYENEINKEFGGSEALNEIVFWVIDDDDRIVIDKRRFKEFLLTKGIYRYRMSVDKWMLIKITHNVVSQINRADVKKMVFDYLESIKRFDIYQYFAQNVTKTFADDYLELLPENNVQFKRDTKDSVNIFYTNGFLYITSKDIIFNTYDKLDGLIWDTQILKREYREQPSNVPCDFRTFVYNVSAGDNKRYGSICTAIGYLLHDFKNQACSPAVIFNDEVISENPEGRTGKGMLIKAVSHFKNSVYFDGKTFSFEKSFVYQKVDLDTKIMVFDDVRKDFDFEKLFHVITEGIDVEKKNKGTFHLNFKESPKIAITTNYAIKGTGGSHEDRKFELELTRHYTKDFTPRDDFGRMFFEEWDEEEWSKFDRFMSECASLFLKHGLVPQVLVHLPEKQLINRTSQEFYDFMNEWMEEYNDSPKGEFPRVWFYDSFIRENETFKKWLSSKKMCQWVRLFFDFKKITYEEDRNMTGRFFRIN